MHNIPAPSSFNGVEKTVAAVGRIHQTAIQKPKLGQAEIMTMDKRLTTLMMTSVPLVTMDC